MRQIGHVYDFPFRGREGFLQLIIALQEEGYRVSPSVTKSPNLRNYNVISRNTINATIDVGAATIRTDRSPKLDRFLSELKFG